MIVIGVLLFFDWMSLIIILLSDLFGGFTGFDVKLLSYYY